MDTVTTSSSACTCAPLARRSDEVRHPHSIQFELKATGIINTAACHPGPGGVSHFVKKNRNIENADIALWHVFGLHHQVRPEDFPVQPCILTGFKLMPSGFFDGNPGIDLAPERNDTSCHAQAATGYRLLHEK